MKIPPKQVQLAEVGPRFEMKRRSIFSVPSQQILTFPF